MFLFVFYLGGNAGQSNPRRSTTSSLLAQNPEEAWPVLRERPGLTIPTKVAIDGHARLLRRIAIRCICGDASRKAPPLLCEHGWLSPPDSLADLVRFDFFVAKDAQKQKPGARILAKRVRLPA